MPDLKSELMKLENLKFDDDVETTLTPIIETKPNITKAIWIAIKANPLSSAIQIAELMNDGSMVGISTRLKQMTDRGIIARETQQGAYVYRAIGDEYPVTNRSEVLLKAHAARKAKKKAREYYLKNKHKKKVAPKAVEAPTAKSETTQVKATDAEQLINQMTIGMAKAVYLELKKVFES